MSRWNGLATMAFVAGGLTLPPAAVAESVPGTARSRVGSAERLDVTLTGPLLAGVAPRQADGTRGLVLLVEEEGSPVLYRLDPEGGDLSRLATPLPEEAHALDAVDLDGDGSQELLVGGKGSAYLLEYAPGGAEGHLERVIHRPWFNLASLEDDLIRVPDAERNWVAAADVGRLWLHRASDSGSMDAVCECELPVFARRGPAGLLLETPGIRPLAEEGRVPRFAVGPEERGGRRLATRIVDPLAPGAEPVESLSRLPEPEEVQESFYLTVGGRPMLFVSTLETNKRGVFDKKRLRGFPLGPVGRNRSGSAPAVAAELDCLMWHSIAVEVVDVDADGREDVAAVHRRGLGGGKVSVTVFLAGADGRLGNRTRSTTFEDKEARRFRYGADLTGDGVPDLAVVGDGVLSVHRGLGGSGKKLLEKRPLAPISLALDEVGAQTIEVSVGSDVEAESGEESDEETGSSPSELTFVDLDGDGRDEVLLAIANSEGRGLLRWVRFTPGTR